MNKQAIKDSTIKAIDPVCGMKVNKQKAAATSVYNGETYYFCKTGCKTNFDQDPEKRLKEGPMGMLEMMRELIVGVFKKNVKD